MISLFAVLGEIEPLNFLFLSHSKTDDEIHNLQNDYRTNRGKHPSNYNSGALIENLAGIAFEYPRREDITLRIFENWVHRTGCEYAGQQSPERSTRAMYAESIERIVVAEAGFDFGYHEVAKYTRNQADQQSRHGTDKIFRR